MRESRPLSLSEDDGPHLHKHEFVIVYICFALTITLKLTTPIFSLVDNDFASTTTLKFKILILIDSLLFEQSFPLFEIMTTLIFPSRSFL